MNPPISLSSRFATLAITLILLSCSSTITNVHDDRINDQLRASVFLDIPYVPQSSAKDCGAAALSSVAKYWGIDITPKYILRHYPLKPGAAGYSMGELKSIAINEGLAAFVIPGQFALIEEQILSGRPLVVPLQIETIPVLIPPFDHYVIVAGLSKARSTLILMDPQKGIITLKKMDFMKAWNAKKKAMLLAAPSVR